MTRKRSFKQEARRDYKGSRKFRTKTGADMKGRPKRSQRKKYWVAAHSRFGGWGKRAIRVKGHWRRTPRRRRRRR